MRKNLLITMMISLLVSACVSSKPPASADNECIPPLFDIAFPIVTSEPSMATPRQIPPQGDWQIQEALPFPQDKFGSIYMNSKQNELLFTG